jgi:hypothetical protein
MKLARLALAALALAGCGLPRHPFALQDPADFREQVADPVCEWLAACYPELYGTVEDCIVTLEEAEPVDTAGCGYDPDAAEDCLAAWEALGENCDPEAIPICSEVFPGCGR